MDTVSGVTSQGKICDEALKNFREVFELWFERRRMGERTGT